MACPNRNPPQLSFDAYARRGKHIRTISCALASIECIRVNRSAKIWGKIETEDIFGRHTVYDRSEQDAQVIKGPGGLLSLKDTGDDGIIASGDFAFYIKLFDLESGEPISETIRWSPFISPMERPVSVDVGPLTVVYCSTSNCFRGVVSIRIVNEEEEEEEEMVVTGTVRAQKIIKRELDRADSSSTTVLFEDYGDGVRVSPGSKFPLPRSRVVVLAFYDQKSIGSHTEIEVDLRLGGGDEVIARGSVGFWVDYHDKILAPKTETITGPKGHKVRVTMDFTDYLPPRGLSNTWFNGVCAQHRPFEFFPQAGPKSNVEVMGMLRHSQKQNMSNSSSSSRSSWDRPISNESHHSSEAAQYGFHQHHPLMNMNINMMEVMQQSSHHQGCMMSSSGSFPNSASTTHYHHHQVSSISAARDDDENRAIPPSFIDFLGVGAT